MQLQLVDKPGRQELTGDVRSPADRHVPVASGRAGQLDGPVHPVRNEDELDRSAG